MEDCMDSIKNPKGRKKSGIALDRKKYGIPCSPETIYRESHRFDGPYSTGIRESLQDYARFLHGEAEATPEQMLIASEALRICGGKHAKHSRAIRRKLIEDGFFSYPGGSHALETDIETSQELGGTVFIVGLLDPDILKVTTTGRYHVYDTKDFPKDVSKILLKFAEKYRVKHRGKDMKRCIGLAAPKLLEAVGSVDGKKIPYPGGVHTVSEDLHAIAELAYSNKRSGIDLTDMKGMVTYYCLLVEGEEFSRIGVTADNPFFAELEKNNFERLVHWYETQGDTGNAKRLQGMAENFGERMEKIYKDWSLADSIAEGRAAQALAITALYRSGGSEGAKLADEIIEMRSRHNQSMKDRLSG